MLIEYDGTKYEGWQSQKSGKTIEDVITGKLEMLTGEKIKLKGQGRTDAGVHALGQTANFVMESEWKLDQFHHNLNKVLPDDIYVKKIEETASDFSARFDAKSRTYEYRILSGDQRDPFLIQYSWYVSYRLDIKRMNDAARYLVGTHDFSSFRATLCSAKNPIRKLEKIEITKNGDMISILFKANAFLHHMVRNIVGLLVEIGYGRFEPVYAKEVLDYKDITKKSFKIWRKAPARGLFLIRVAYD